MTTTTHRRRSAAFTLVELAVVILIISMLLVMAVPSVNKAIIQAKRDTSKSIINQLDSACNLFKIDHDFYPRSCDTNYPNWTGSQLLRLQLTGYGPDENDDGAPGNSGDNSDLSTLATDDGVPGLGFRTAPQGTTFGPYGASPDMDTLLLDQWPVFPDSFGNEIFYYRYDEDDEEFNDDHNDPKDSGGGEMSMAFYAQRGWRDEGGNVVWGGLWRRDFLLFSAGPDGQFHKGTDVGAADGKARAFQPEKPFAIDDVTNFATEIGS